MTEAMSKKRDPPKTFSALVIEEPDSSRRTTPYNWLLSSTQKASTSKAWSDPVWDFDMSQITPSTQDRQKATVVDNTPPEEQPDEIGGDGHTPTGVDIHSVDEGQMGTDTDVDNTPPEEQPDEIGGEGHTPTGVVSHFLLATTCLINVLLTLHKHT
ncbi:uncharacterized protein LOC134686428 [Mytilus trossulus]|uniref:uncharacterized protein LOC134686428 n=1 Tax=Mytilus trossulus TaxID=6551 RepID=UPI0030059090